MEKSAPPQSCSHELIVIIAGKGQTDRVMNAAREAGARGGTVLHGKGTGSGAEKFHNISIAEEKEVILIVSDTENKAAIMRAVLMMAGPDTESGAVVFSLPTTAVAGHKNSYFRSSSDIFSAALSLKSSPHTSLHLFLTPCTRHTLCVLSYMIQFSNGNLSSK